MNSDDEYYFPANVEQAQTSPSRKTSRDKISNLSERKNETTTVDHLVDDDKPTENHQRPTMSSHLVTKQQQLSLNENSAGQTLTTGNDTLAINKREPAQLPTSTTEQDKQRDLSHAMHVINALNSILVKLVDAFQTGLLNTFVLSGIMMSPNL